MEIALVKGSGLAALLTGDRAREMTVSHTGRVISPMGRAARNVPEKPEGLSFSARETGRSLGSRRVRRVRPAVLMRSVNHRDSSTTMGYHVGLDADGISGEWWAADSTYGSTPAGWEGGAFPLARGR
jgi:hypothetical protein